MMHPRMVVQDVCAGTLHLRSKGATYLPKEPAEKDEHYAYRLARAILFNAVERTLHGLVGMVFRNDPKLGEDVPVAIRGTEATDGQAAVEGHWENIDLAGTHGSVFCKEVFTNAMRDGHAAILVDMPPALQEGATLDDEIRAQRRPYWVSYTADQIINWRTKVVNGKTVLDLVIFKECSQEADGAYGEKMVTRYRVLRPGMWEIYRDSDDGKEIVFESGGPISLPEIPVAVVYSRKCGTLTSMPPLRDLATTNVSHYQKYSDFSIYMHLASRPLLWFRGRDTSQAVKVSGPYMYFDVTGDNGLVAFAETSGAALGAASQDIKDLEERMAILGLSLLVRRTGAQITATEERNDQIEESSDLATAARSLQDAMELALKFHAQYLNPTAETGGSVELGAALDEMQLTPEEMAVWSNAVAVDQYSRETMWDVFEQGGKNPPNFDPKRETERLKKQKKEKMELSEAMMRDFDRGGAPEDEDDDATD